MKTMNEKEAVTRINDENLREFSPEIQEAYLYLKKNEGTILSPGKYYAALECSISQDLKYLYNIKPDMPLKDAASHIFQRLPTFIPGDKVVELTKFVVSKWEELCKNVENAPV